MKILNVIGKILLGINVACLAITLLIGLLAFIAIIAAPEEINNMGVALSSSELLLLCLLVLAQAAALLIINLLGIITKTNLGVTVLLCVPMVLCILMLVLSLVPEFRNSFNEGFREGYRGGMPDINGYGVWLAINIYTTISYVLPVIVRFVMRFSAGSRQLTQIYQ